MLTSLDYADKPAECTCFYMHTWPELPYRGSLCLQIFHTNFWSNLRLADHFFLTLLWIVTERLSEISMTKTSAHKTPFLCECPSYISDVFLWQELKLLCTHMCKKLLESSSWWCAFNFCVPITFLAINICIFSHHLQSSCILLLL
jgi:hypothetical protein